jgi:hypothetical protein
MDELELIETVRNICGDWDTDNYYLDLNGLPVPVFGSTDHEAVFPHILIRPFITSGTLAETTYYCGESANQIKANLKYNNADFQVDIFAKDLIQLIKIKRAIEHRIKGFNDVDIFVFQDPLGWQAYDPSTYVNDEYDSSRAIIKLSDPLAALTKTDSVAEVLATNGSWFLDDSGLYVNPLIDLDSVEIYELLDGHAFVDGSLLYEKGINGIRIFQSRKTKDKVPKVERWTIEMTITYRDITTKPASSIVEEMDLNVQEN